MTDKKNHPGRLQWAELEQQAGKLFESISLRCDGYLVSTRWERSGKVGNRFVLVPYVNGYVRGKWAQAVDDPADLPEESRRFWRLTTLRLFSPAKIKRLEKTLGKRYCKRMEVYKVEYIPMPSFATAGAFLRHIKKHNQTIEILTVEEYRAAIDPLPKEPGE